MGDSSMGRGSTGVSIPTSVFLGISQRYPHFNLEPGKWNSDTGWGGHTGEHREGLVSWKEHPCLHQGVGV